MACVAVAAAPAPSTFTVFTPKSASNSSVRTGRGNLEDFTGCTLLDCSLATRACLEGEGPPEGVDGFVSVPSHTLECVATRPALCFLRRCMKHAPAMEMTMRPTPPPIAPPITAVEEVEEEDLLAQ